MIVIKRMDEVQVYLNDDGDVVIVQTDRDGDASYVIIPVDHAEAVWLAIRSAAVESASRCEQSPEAR